MIDIKLVRENPEIIRKNLEKRKLNFPLDELIQVDKDWRKSLQELEKLRALRNKVSLEIAKKKDDAKIREMKNISAKIKKRETDVEQYELREKELLMSCPNILHESVPVGNDDRDNVEIRRWGEIPNFSFEPKPHGQIIEALNMADFERAVKISGAGFYYLKGGLALLDQALMRFAIDFLVRRGYLPVEPPLMMRRKAYEGVVDLSDFENVMYKIEGEDAYLIATSEHPMGAMLMDEIIPEKNLPIKLCGISACFRKEIGKHGVDTKGIFRTHQFNKIEQFIFCKPEDSWNYHEELIKNAEQLFQALKIPYRVVNVCTGDIGTLAAKKYDIEAWSPRQKKYVEVASCSNCTDYQARRLNIRCKTEKGERRFIHTLNSTAIATSRALVAIIENYQEKDGTIKVPNALVPYMGGRKIIGKE